MPSIEALEQLLVSHGVSVADWGTGSAKTPQNLLDEITCGESRLHLDDVGNLRRSVSAVGVDIFFIDPRQGMFRLVEAEQLFRSGRRRRRRLKTSIAEKLLPGERPIEAARRAIEEELGLSTVGLRLKCRGSEVVEENSGSYPGLCSIRSLTYFECALSTGLFNPLGYKEHQEDKTTSFAWCSAEVCA
jgi:hypothetical protein